MTSLETQHIAPQPDPSEKRVETSALGQPQETPPSPASPLGTRHVQPVPAQRQDLGTQHIDPAPSQAPPPAVGESVGTRQVAPSPLITPPIEGTLPPNTLLQDRYQIIGVLGMGGMSTVYKARDLRFASVTRLCAVKEARPSKPRHEINIASIAK